jgi:transcriptional regulator with XRE-family HTH domain
MGESIGDRIREFRRKLGLSQAEMAEKTGISLNSLNRYENSHREVGAAFITQLGEMPGCDLRWLLGLEDSGAGQERGGEGSIPVLRTLPENLNRATQDQIEGWLKYPGAPADGYAVRASDDALLPVVKKGDFLLFQPVEEAAHGDLVVLVDDWGDIRVRRIRELDGAVYYVGDQPDVPPVKSDQRHRLVGRVVRALREFVL